MLELWFVSRALGLVALLMLTLVVALGVLHNTSVVHRSSLGLPRFVLVALHRNLSLMAVVLVAAHVVTAVVTPYARLGVVDAVVPGLAAYDPVAAGLGALAADLVVVITVTSVLRRHLSRRWWFLVHWTSYACWPVAVAHAVLATSWRGTTWWTVAVPVLCSAAFVAALLYRRRDRRRVGVPLGERGAPRRSR